MWSTFCIDRLSASFVPCSGGGFFFTFFASVRVLSGCTGGAFLGR